MTNRRQMGPSAGTVAVTPFPTNNVEIRREKGIAIPNQRDRLTPLTVIYGNKVFQKGDIVYCEGEQCAQVWARRIYTLDDAGAEVKFILMPVGVIQIHERANGFYGLSDE